MKVLKAVDLIITSFLWTLEVFFFFHFHIECVDWFIFRYKYGSGATPQ